MSKQSFDPARRAAAAALVRVHRGGWAAAAANQALGGSSLTPRDRAFAGALFFGSAERLVTLDALLAPLLKHPLDALDVEVRAVLETGLYQLIYMRVPARAAVDEAVKLARAFGKTSAAGLVNAVLRRMSAQVDAVRKELSPGANAGEEQAASMSTALVARLLGARLQGDELQRVCLTWSVGEAVARAVMDSLPGGYDAFFAATFSSATLPLRVNTLKTTPAELAGELARRGATVHGGTGSCDLCRVRAAALLVDLPGGVAGEPLFESGLYHVQGLASQFAVACLAPQPGERVLDLCAAPGGKAATIAQQMGGGTGLTVCDANADRLELAKQLFARLGIEGAYFAVNDGAVYNEALCGQDAVLCDVPCSGLGVLAKKPDLRYAAGDNFAALPELQLKILATAARYVKKGGRLLYATCTVRRQENEEVVRAFLCGNPAFAVEHPAVLAAEECGGHSCPWGNWRSACGGTGDNDSSEPRDDSGMLTLLPHRTGTDGFFIALLRHNG